MNLITKGKLYNSVHTLKMKQFFDPDFCGFNTVQCASLLGVYVRELAFKTKGLRGMAIPGEDPQPDIILLNKWRTDREHNVDCAHEIMHLSFHSHLHRKTFNCLEKITANQDAFIEWQANEGAAEYLVPYRVFIPMVCDSYHDLIQYDVSLFHDYCEELSQIFFVPPAVIDYRMRNLRYEIHQCMNGVPVDKVELVSNNELAKRNIQINSIPDTVFQNQQKMEEEIYNMTTGDV